MGHFNTINTEYYKNAVIKEAVIVIHIKLFDKIVQSFEIYSPEAKIIIDKKSFSLTGEHDTVETTEYNQECIYNK